MAVPHHSNTDILKMTKCTKCSKQIDRYGDTIFCNGACKGVFHLECGGIIKEEFCQFQTSKNINSWACLSCSMVSPPVPFADAANLPQSFSLENKIDAILSYIKQMDNNLQRMDTRLQQVENKLISVIEENNYFKEKIVAIEARCEFLEKKKWIIPKTFNHLW